MEDDKEFRSRADEILYEYFKNNRYPKRAEKVKLAQKANVSFQYVVNFFYSTRSRIKKMEKQCNSAVETEQVSECQLRNLRLRGDRNDLYVSKPVIVEFEEFTECEITNTIRPEEWHHC